MSSGGSMTSTSTQLLWMYAHLINDDLLSYAANKQQLIWNSRDRETTYHSLDHAWLFQQSTCSNQAPFREPFHHNNTCQRQIRENADPKRCCKHMCKETSCRNSLVAIIATYAKSITATLQHSVSNVKIYQACLCAGVHKGNSWGNHPCGGKRTPLRHPHFRALQMLTEKKQFHSSHAYTVARNGMFSFKCYYII